MPMLMPEKVRSTNMLRSLLLVLALLTLPPALLGLSVLASAMPGADVGFFHAEIRVDNHTGETLYITPITTTYAEPRVILQTLALRQRDHRIKPNASLRLTYDTADFPLAGLIVCRENDDCRALENTRDKTLSLDDLSVLPAADKSWLTAREKRGLYNLSVLIYAIFIFLPLIFYGMRWYLGKELEKTYS